MGWGSCTMKADQLQAFCPHDEDVHAELQKDSSFYVIVDDFTNATRTLHTERESS